MKIVHGIDNLKIGINNIIQMRTSIICPKIPTVLDVLCGIIANTIYDVYPRTNKKMDLVFWEKIEPHSFCNLDIFSALELEIIYNITWETLILNEKVTKVMGICRRTPQSYCYYNIVNKNGITIKDVTEIAFRLKNSKDNSHFEFLESIRIGKVLDDFIKLIFEFRKIE